VRFVAQGTLASALSLAAAAGNKKTPALARLMAADGVVSICCDNGNIAIKAAAAATIQEPGEAATAVDRLAALVTAFSPNAPVTISTTENMATIICGNSKSRLPTIPLIDLPAALALEGEIGRVEISGGDCLILLEPSTAAGTETTRQYLRGVLLHDVDGKLVSIATDGRRLIRTSIPAGAFSAGRDLVIPTEAVATLHKIIVKTKSDMVKVIRSRTLLSVAASEFEFTTRLIDAGDSGFPAYERVIPPPLVNSVTIIRAELIASLSRLAAVVTAAGPLAALAWTGAPQLNVFLARQPDDGSDVIAAEATTGAARVVVPLQQLADMLDEFADVRLRLEADEGRPLVIHGENEKLALICQSTLNGKEAAV
jgi:DNA polymerase-3 subunit beta